MSQHVGVDVNYAYFVHYVLSLPNARRLRVLDFGCGSADVVSLLRAEGIECFGCDVFYEVGGTDQGPAAERLRDLMHRGWVHAIGEAGDLPYPPQSFDVILANQVFEHVQDMDSAVRRLDRVLKDDGVMCFHFPTRDGWREGHIGIPFAHWFSKHSRLRRPWTLTLRRLGLGYHKDSRTPEEWADFQLRWIDQYCFYRTAREARQLLERGHIVEHNEIQYVRFRGRHRPLLKALLEAPALAPLWSAIFRRLGFVALVARKRLARTEAAA